MKLYWFLLTALLAFGFARPSYAAVLFTNLGQPDNGASGFNELDWRLASDFSTDGTRWTITSITAQMGNSSDFVTHNVTFSIFADNGSGKPGTLVANFDTPASIPPGVSGPFTATSAGMVLEPDTPYWVVGQQNAPESLGTVTWRFTESVSTDSGPFSTVTGTQMQSTPIGGGLWVDGGLGNQMFSLEGVITPVPEPQTWLALLVTVGTFVTFRWWRQSRVSPDSLPDRGHAS